MKEFDSDLGRWVEIGDIPDELTLRDIYIEQRKGKALQVELERKADGLAHMATEARERIHAHSTLFVLLFAMVIGLTGAIITVAAST